MDITGILKVKGAGQVVSEKFTKREFVLTDNSSQYSQHISFQLTQDKTSLLDRYNVGDEIKVHFNLRGREWTSPQGETKYFNTLEAWRIEGLQTSGGNNQQQQQQQQQSNQQQQQVNQTSQTANSAEEDLPF